MANGFGDMLQQNPGIKGSQRVPLKGSGFQRLLAVLEGEPLEERIVQPGSGQTAEVSQVLPIFMMSFTSSPGSVSPGSRRGEGLHGENQGHGSGSSAEPGRLP